MIEIKPRKKVIAASIVIAISIVLTASMLVYSALADTAELQNKHIAVKAKGFAFQRIDNETIKQHPTELTLTLELGERNGTRVSITGVNGTVDVNGVIYTIESGKGVISAWRHVALIQCEGVDANGNEVTLGVRAVYFWWGWKLYAFRAQALLSTADGKMLLLLRGVARVY